MELPQLLSKKVKQFELCFAICTSVSAHPHKHTLTPTLYSTFSLSVSLPLFLFIREIIVCFVAASCFYYYAIYASRTYAAFIFTAVYCGYYCILPANELIENFQNDFQIRQRCRQTFLKSLP